MAIAIVLFVATLALARGGYAAWGILVLEIGAVVLVLWMVLEVLWGTSEEKRQHYLRQPRSRRGEGDIEIVGPGGSEVDIDSKPADRYLLLFGYPFKKAHVGIPFGLLLVWIALSLVPLESGWLEALSPRAAALRGDDAAPAPVSLAPFLTLRSLWMGAAYLALVFVGAHVASSPKRVERLSLLLFLCGIAFGLYGMAQWLFGLQELFGRDPTTAHLRASGSFGNRNHYAAFMEMLFLTGLGWMAVRRARIVATFGRRKRGFLRQVEESGGKLFFLSLGVVITSLGLVFSLSRSGITFALVGAAVLVLARPVTGFRSSSRRRFEGLVAVGLAVVAMAAWIGLDPVVHRFKLLPDEWEAERGRTLVWADSLSAVPDFAVTGSGLSSYRYVFPIYRSFGGTTTYSWAHNDYLQALIELGLPGFLLLLWGMAVVVYRAHGVRQRLSDDPELVTLHAGYLAAGVAVALHTVTDFGLHLAANAALFSVIVGVTVGLEGSRRKKLGVGRDSLGEGD